LIYYLIALAIIAIDQISKWLIVAKMEIGESFSIIENVLYITSHRNRGAAWGILEGQMWFFYIVTIIVTVVLIYFLQTWAKGKLMLSLGISFMLAGAIGNFIDRLFRGEVVDFIDVYIFTYNYPIFNIADSSLVIGVIIMAIQMIKEEKAAKKE
jgi:signal peptidase II